MSFGSTPKKPMYEEMKDTPYITQARDLSDRGYKGYVGNYENVNVFSPEVQNQMAARNQAIYNRAEGDFDRQYRDTMQKLANKNYGQFGNTSSTPALYRTDMANLEQQRKLADLAYDKALNYENVVNNELKRRYDTLNMYKTMYDYGQIPHDLDLRNWNIRNQNKDREFSNDIVDYNDSTRWARWGASVADPFGILGLADVVAPSYNDLATGNTGRFSGPNAVNALAAIMGLAGGMSGEGGILGGGSGSSSLPYNSLNSNVSSYGSGGDYGRQAFLTSGNLGVTSSPTLSPWTSSFNTNFGR